MFDSSLSGLLGFYILEARSRYVIIVGNVCKNSCTSVFMCLVVVDFTVGRIV